MLVNDTLRQGIFYPDCPQILRLIKHRKDPRHPTTPEIRHIDNSLQPIPLSECKGWELCFLCWQQPPVCSQGTDQRLCHPTGPHPFTGSVQFNCANDCSLTLLYKSLLATQHVALAHGFLGGQATCSPVVGDSGCFPEHLKSWMQKWTGNSC